MSREQRQRLFEVFRREYEATKNVESAVVAVATTVKAQLEMRFETERESTRPPKVPGEVKRMVILRKYEKLAAASVLEAAAREFCVDPHHLSYRWARLSPDHLHARWCAWVILRKPPFHMSTPEIAHVSRVRDHTRVLYGLREIRKQPALLAAVERIEAALRRDEAPAAQTADNVEVAA